MRLSFALADWVALGKQYPKALETLKSIRDEKTARLLKGERTPALFHDVASINEQLGESKATVELFRKLDAAEPEFAASLYDIAESALVAAEEFALARKHLGDPKARFDTARRRFEAGLQFARRSRSHITSRQAFENIFVESVVRLLTILEKTDDLASARALQSEALSVLDSPVIRAALPR